MVALNSQLEEQIASYFAVAETPRVDRWTERTMFVPFGERQGLLNLDNTPWAREPINSLTDPDVRVEAGIYGSQLAKTTQATAVALATIALLRQSLVWMWPTEGMGRSFSQTRLQPIVEASPELRALKHPNHDLFKNLELHFRTGVLSLVGSHSRIQAKSRSVPVVVVDEIEDLAAATEKETDPINSIEERTKTFTDKKIFLFGSCLLESGPAWQQYLIGDQRHFLLPCPDCGTRQALEFRGAVWLVNRQTGELELRGSAREFRLRWDPAARIDEHNWDFDAVAASAHYLCPECGAKIRDEHKRAMLLAGAWHPTTRSRVFGHRSRRINSLYPIWPNTSFGAVALKFLQSHHTPGGLQNFTNNWEARPFSAGVDLADKAVVAKRLGYILGSHVKGERRGERSLLLVDVQRTHLVYGLFEYDSSGAMHLIDFGYTRDFDSLREIDDALLPSFVAVDTRYRSQEVYEAVHARRGRWIALRGEERGAPLSPNLNFDPFTGDRAGRQGLYVITLLHLNTDLWGEEMLGRLYPAKDSSGSVAGLDAALRGDIAAANAEGDDEAPRVRDFFVPADFAKHPDFVRQLFSEYIVEYIDPRGKRQRKWKRSSNNHLYDLTKYALAVGSFLNLTRIAATARKQVEAATAARAKAAQQEMPLTQPSGGTRLFN